MKKPRRILVIAGIVPFLAGCMGTLAQPLPEPALRSSTNVRGVVLGDPESGERIEFSRVDHVEWTDSTLSIVGALATPDGGGTDGSNTTRARTFALSDIGAVLVAGVEPNKTSLLIAGVLVGVTVIGAFLVTGKTTATTIF
ncbi:MAG: hypothetical protein IIB36_08295 [Gemmatimonadetes bacterium]|nr:hypothetical protein [Gemmatimonadota bacterium]